jgi:hypothetical protein
MLVVLEEEGGASGNKGLQLRGLAALDHKALSVELQQMNTA